jgi:hypothetical protein
MFLNVFSISSHLKLLIIPLTVTTLFTIHFSSSHNVRLFPRVRFVIALRLSSFTDEKEGLYATFVFNNR